MRIVNNNSAGTETAFYDIGVDSSSNLRVADAHHLVHWFDHGPTDIANAALLCRSHHTVVHRERYAGAVVTDEQGRPSVQWYLVPGAYDDQVEAMRRAGTLPRQAAEVEADHLCGEGGGVSGDSHTEDEIERDEPPPGRP